MKWFKKKERALPEDTVCRNCGAQTVGRYCHECGQDLLAGVGQPILKLIMQIFDNVFALEGKTPRTLAHLMIRPGFLSEEYRIGKVNRYVHPVKLFWMSSLIFFALLISQMDFDNNQNKITSEEIVKIESTDQASPTDSLTNNTTSEKVKEEKKRKAQEDFRVFALKNIPKYAPYTTFLLIPIFALLLAWFFRRKKLFYMFHLVFALHFHTFLAIFCSILLIVGIFTPNFDFPSWLSLTLFLTPGIYLVIGFHRFYRTKSWWQAVLKAIGITLLYVILIFTVTVLLIISVMLIFFPEIFALKG